MANSSNNESAPVYSLKHFLPPIVVLWKTCTLIKETNSFGDIPFSAGMIMWGRAMLGKWYWNNHSPSQLICFDFPIKRGQNPWYLLRRISVDFAKFKPGEFSSPSKSILPFSLGFRRNKKNQQTFRARNSLSSHHQDHDTFSTEIPYVICHFHPWVEG